MTVGEAVTQIDDLLKSYESVTTDLQTKMLADSNLLKEVTKMKNTPMVFAASMSEDMEKLRLDAMGQIKQLQEAAVQSNGKINRKKCIEVHIMSKSNVYWLVVSCQSRQIALFKNFMRLTQELLTKTLRKKNTLTSIHGDIMNQNNGNT